MNINQLEYFVSIAETLSFTRSAELLHMTQSALTHAVNKLEEELEAPLFLRQGRKIALTPYGETFYKYSKEALDLIYCGVSEVRKQCADQVDHLSIAIVSNMEMDKFEPIITAFNEKYPKINFHFHELHYNDLLKATKMRTYSFGICGIRENTLKQHSLNYLEIAESSSYVFLHRDSPFAQNEYLTNTILQNEHIIYLSEDARNAVAKAQPELNITDSNTSVCTNIRLALNMVLMKKGILIKISPTTGIYHEPEIVVIPLKDTSTKFGFVWSDNTKFSYTEKLFLDFCKSYIKGKK